MTGASLVESLLHRATTALRTRPDALLISADGPDRPDLILVDRRAGIYAIEFEPHGATVDDRAPFVRLNRKRSGLREALGELADAGVGAAVVLGAVQGRLLDSATAATNTALAVADLDDPVWPDLLPARPLDDVAFRGIVDRLAPAVVFTRGIPRTVDAVLVDEVQDMDPAWLHFLLDVVRPGRGGAVLAGDPAQSLYRESDLNDVLRGRSVVHHTLVRPYRSTKPILTVASVLSPSSPVVGIEWSPDGEPVDLIWASSWSEQAACIAWEIGTMVGDGYRKAGDIAVLVTQRRGTLGRLHAALDAEDVPYEVIDRANVALFDPAAPTVKLLTVHSGKGHEFPRCGAVRARSVADGRGRGGSAAGTRGIRRDDAREGSAADLLHAAERVPGTTDRPRRRHSSMDLARRLRGMS